jgi:hypothetical protein
MMSWDNSIGTPFAVINMFELTRSGLPPTSSISLASAEFAAEQYRSAKAVWIETSCAAPSLQARGEEPKTENSDIGRPSCWGHTLLMVQPQLISNALQVSKSRRGFRMFSHHVTREES